MSDSSINPTQALLDRGRIRGASRMIINEGTAPEAVTEDQIREVANDVELFRRQQKLTVKAIAEAVGYAHATVSEFLQCKYKGSNGAVAIALQNWLIGEEERSSRPATTQFVWTNVAILIRDVANYCLDYRKIGLVYGPDTAGLGKTTALSAILQTLGPRAATLITIDKVDANPTGLLKKLCVGLHIDHAGTNKQRFERIITKLTGRRHLLMIDQIHNIRAAKDDKPLYILTDIYDALNAENTVGSGAQLWCGTADMVEYLNRQRRKASDESLAQIRSRIFPRVDLMEMRTTGGPDGKGQPCVTVDQVMEMFAKNQLKLTPAAARFLCSLINVPDSGGVRMAVQIVEYATCIGQTRAFKSIDIPLLQAAMVHGLTGDLAKNLIDDVEKSTRVAKVG